MDGVNHNGSGKSTNLELPAAREAVIEQAQRVYQEVAHERDQLLREVGSLRSDIAGYKVALEANASYIAQMESRMAEALMVRDEAVRQAAEVRTVLHNIMTIGQPYLHSQLPVTPAEMEPDDDPEARDEDQRFADKRNRPVGGPRPL